MRKKLIIVFVIITVTLLLIPVRKVYEDGGTQTYISGTIIGVLFAQALNLNLSQGFYMYHFMEVITWIIGIIILYRKPKEFVVELGLSIVIAFLYQLLDMPHFG